MAGSSNFTCAETYGGAAPFSELESQALRNYLTKIYENLAFYNAMHAFSQLVLLPWGSTNLTYPYDAQLKLIMYKVGA